jgi:hypothetical protein
MENIMHTSVEKLWAVKITDTPRSGRTVSGYGGRIPTSYMLRYGSEKSYRWHRVRVMSYGNAGSAYVMVGGHAHFLDTWCEAVVEAVRGGQGSTEAIVKYRAMARDYA